jgi:isopentenyl diphosphate isomerase/L-lactate dehydrogenase-like FMN-dependent dehydrogenase
MDKRDRVSVFDYEAAAREKLPKIAYDYCRSGADDEITLHENHAAYERIQLKPGVLIDTSRRDLTTTVLGEKVSMPILVAPTAFHRMAHRRGGCNCKGRRERDIKNRFRLPKGLSIKNLMPAGREQFPDEKKDSGLAAYVAWQFDPTLSWKDVEWLSIRTDARPAADANTAVSALALLPAVVIFSSFITTVLKVVRIISQAPFFP